MTKKTPPRDDEAPRVQAGVPPRQDQIRPTTGVSPSASGRPRDDGDGPLQRSGPQNPPAEATAETPSEADLTDRETM